MDIRKKIEHINKNYFLSIFFNCLLLMKLIAGNDPIEYINLLEKEKKFYYCLYYYHKKNKKIDVELFKHYVMLRNFTSKYFFYFVKKENISETDKNIILYIIDKCNEYIDNINKKDKILMYFINSKSKKYLNFVSKVDEKLKEVIFTERNRKE